MDDIVGPKLASVPGYLTEAAWVELLNPLATSGSSSCPPPPGSCSCGWR